MVYLKYLIFLLLPAVAQAQVFMRPFDNAAQMALGGTGIAYPGVDNGLTNPAQLGTPVKMGIMAFSALPYSLTDWQSVGIQALVQTGRNSGFGLEVLHAGIPVYAEQRVQVQYGRKLGEKFSLGGQLMALRADAAEYGNANTVSFGIGMLAQPFERLTIGAQVTNPFSQQLGDIAIPAALRIGAAWHSSNLVWIQTEVEKDLSRPTQIKAGIEYRPHSILRLRLGARTGPTRMAMGAGLYFKNGLALDFGTEWHSTLGLTPAMMIRYVKR
jgi:hypothetical protein